jgi:hypothetical protein
MTHARAILLVILLSQSASANVALLQDGSDKNVILGAILIHSEIKKGDFAAFLKVADRLSETLRDRADPVPFILVKLDSPGGDVAEAMQIGRLIRQRFMNTMVDEQQECASACILILMAGVARMPQPSAHIGLHRPRFDPAYFADLAPEEAHAKYNALVEDLRKYFIDEMGGNEDVFRLMLSTPSDHVRFLSFGEMQKFGLFGTDPAWDEYSEAQSTKRFGARRWQFIKQCVQSSGGGRSCVQKAYEQYPDK